MSCIAPCRMPRGYGRLSNSFQHPTHVNLSQAHEKTEYPMLGFNYVSGTSIAKWAKVSSAPNATASTFRAHRPPRFSDPFLAGAALLLLAAALVSILGFRRGRAFGLACPRGHTTASPGGGKADMM
eukprot:scaffold11013_cov35-Tisochrysis_lutea.AAC.2